MKTTTISQQHLDWLLASAVQDAFLCCGCPANTDHCHKQVFEDTTQAAAYCLPRIRKALRKAALAVDLDAKHDSGRQG